MAWIVGIDEAGYGPNLGPFVMTAVACAVPDAHGGVDLWAYLHEAIRRPATPCDGRLVVGDSKQVYSPAKGLRELEASVLALLDSLEMATSGPVGGLMDLLCVGHELASETWYTGTTSLPSETAKKDISSGSSLLRAACAKQLASWPLIQSMVVCPGEFNRLIDRHASKGAVLGHALQHLFRAIRERNVGREPMRVFVDKHGGRNNYVGMLQEMLPDRMVMAREERMNRSVYEALGGDHAIRFTFQPRADDEHCCVALASMVSKYVRETLMHEFNLYWRTHLPDLKPTAGYPLDAGRFYAEIRPVIQRLGLAEEVVWRKR